jgi:hypothetical protein
MCTAKSFAASWPEKLTHVPGWVGSTRRVGERDHPQLCRRSDVKKGVVTPVHSRRSPGPPRSRPGGTCGDQRRSPQARHAEARRDGAGHRPARERTDPACHEAAGHRAGQVRPPVRPAYEKDWTDLPMRDDGQEEDEKAGDGVYSARVPANCTGVTSLPRLIRSREPSADREPGPRLSS